MERGARQLWDVFLPFDNPRICLAWRFWIRDWDRDWKGTRLISLSVMRPKIFFLPWCLGRRFVLKIARFLYRSLPSADLGKAPMKCTCFGFLSNHRVQNEKPDFVCLSPVDAFSINQKPNSLMDMLFFPTYLLQSLTSKAPIIGSHSVSFWHKRISELRIPVPHRNKKRRYTDSSKDTKLIG